VKIKNEISNDCEPVGRLERPHQFLCAKNKKSFFRLTEISSKVT